MVSTRTSSILGPDGKPVNVQVLSQEIATPTVAGVRRTHEERVASGLTPEKLATILRDANEGNGRSYLTLAEEMEERYLHYCSQLQTRRLAIESVQPTLDAEDVDSKIVDTVQELLNDDGFGEALGSLSDGIGKSYAAVEMMWEYERKLLQPVKYVVRDQRFAGEKNVLRKRCWPRCCSNMLRRTTASRPSGKPRRSEGSRRARLRDTCGYRVSPLSGKRRSRRCRNRSSGWPGCSMPRLRMMVRGSSRWITAQRNSGTERTIFARTCLAPRVPPGARS